MNLKFQKLKIACLLFGVFSCASFAYAEIDQSPIIEDIVCIGNTSTDCEFIRDHVFLSRGDRLDEDEIQNAKIRLGLVTHFSSSDI